MIVTVSAMILEEASTAMCKTPILATEAFLTKSSMK